jgi:AcrR family transcriptional regulator
MAIVGGTGNGRVSERRSGRRPGDSGTKSEILRAARKVFAMHGYRGATMRLIAKEAKVDAALIHHFFTSKAGVYAAAVEASFDLRALIDTVLAAPPKEVGRTLVREFLNVWGRPESREPILAVLRSAVSYDEAADMLAGHVIQRSVGDIVRALNSSEPELRATLISSQLIGMAMLRYVINAEPLASASPETIIEWLGPTIDRYLVGDRLSAE